MSHTQFSWGLCLGIIPPAHVVITYLLLSMSDATGVPQMPFSLPGRFSAVRLPQTGLLETTTLTEHSILYWLAFQRHKITVLILFIGLASSVNFQWNMKHNPKNNLGFSALIWNPINCKMRSDLVISQWFTSISSKVWKHSKLPCIKRSWYPARKISTGM